MVSQAAQINIPWPFREGIGCSFEIYATTDSVITIGASRYVLRPVAIAKHSAGECMTGEKREGGQEGWGGGEGQLSIKA